VYTEGNIYTIRENLNDRHETASAIYAKPRWQGWKLICRRIDLVSNLMDPVGGHRKYVNQTIRSLVTRISWTSVGRDEVLWTEAGRLRLAKKSVKDDKSLRLFLWTYSAENCYKLWRLLDAIGVRCRMCL